MRSFAQSPVTIVVRLMPDWLNPNHDINRLWCASSRVPIERPAYPPTPAIALRNTIFPDTAQYAAESNVVLIIAMFHDFWNNADYDK